MAKKHSEAELMGRSSWRQDKDKSNEAEWKPDSL